MAMQAANAIKRTAACCCLLASITPPTARQRSRVTTAYGRSRCSPFVARIGRRRESTKPDCQQRRIDLGCCLSCLRCHVIRLLGGGGEMARSIIVATAYLCMLARFTLSNAVLVVAALAGLVGGAGDALAGAASYSFDPPPAVIAPLAPASLQQQETDADLLAARAAIIAKDGKAATVSFEQAISRGNAVAMVELADLQDHASEIGVHTDMQHAEDLYHRAALLGYARGQRRVGGLYDKGDGVAEDKDRAAAWYEVAAAQGDDIANAWLAWHFEPREATGDYSQMLHYAEQGERLNGPHSRGVLAAMYLRGWGVAKDEVRAFHLMFLAAEQGEVGAQMLLSHMYREGIGIAADATQAAHWRHRAYTAPEDPEWTSLMP